MKVKPARSADWWYGVRGEREEPRMASLFRDLAKRRMKLPPQPNEIEEAAGGAS